MGRAVGRVAGEMEEGTTNQITKKLLGGGREQGWEGRVFHGVSNNTSNGDIMPVTLS